METPLYKHTHQTDFFKTPPIMASTLLPSAASAATPTSPLAGLMKQHITDREARKQRLDKAVEQTLVIADDLENNCRAALGIQLSNSTNNTHILEQSVKALRQHVATLGKTCAIQSQQYDALAAAVADLGSMEAYLKNTDGLLSRIGDNMEYIKTRLTSEE